VPTPLRISEPQLQAHFHQLSLIVSKATDPAIRAKLDADWNVVPIVAGLVGEGCEHISRNRGVAPVAPMAALRSGLWSWLGYREEWSGEAPAGRTRRFSFKASTITVHFGYRNMQSKPQMFRAEWAGWARWSGSDYSYQAGEAGHPHWQFDALESLQRDDAAERARMYLSELQGDDADPIPRPFLDVHEFDKGAVDDVVSLQELSRMHFASAAAWWKNSPEDAHTHTPATVQHIQGWLRGTLGYIAQELRRLQ
jgi:hypothetical protein